MPWRSRKRARSPRPRCSSRWARWTTSGGRKNQGVLCEKNITHGDIVLEAIPIGGLRMIDGNEADDKIIAVLDGDAMYGHWREVYQSPPTLIERLKHYFLTYKQSPGAHRADVEITHVYGREEAYEVIRRSRADYDRRFAGMKELLAEVLKT